MLLLRRPQRHPSGTDGTNSVPRCESALRPLGFLRKLRVADAGVFKNGLILRMLQTRRNIFELLCYRCQGRARGGERSLVLECVNLTCALYFLWGAGVASGRRF